MECTRPRAQQRATVRAGKLNVRDGGHCDPCCARDGRTPASQSPVCNLCFESVSFLRSDPGVGDNGVNSACPQNWALAATTRFWYVITRSNDRVSLRKAPVVE